MKVFKDASSASRSIRQFGVLKSVGLSDDLREEVSIFIYKIMMNDVSIITKPSTDHICTCTTFMFTFIIPFVED